MTLSLIEGFLHASTMQKGGKSISAKAVGDAGEGEMVGLIDFEGIIDYEIGSVCIMSIPSVSIEKQPPSYHNINKEIDYDLIAVSGVEALVSARGMGYTVDIKFGTPMAVSEAAIRGLNVLLIVTETAVLNHIDQLREYKINYEVIELK